MGIIVGIIVGIGEMGKIKIKGKINKISLRVRRACVLPVGYLVLKCLFIIN